MDSILASANNLTYKLDSMHTLNQPCTHEDMYLIFMKCEQTQSSRLKLFYANAPMISQIEFNDPYNEPFMMCTINKSSLVLCSRITTVFGSFVNLTLYNTKFVLVREKSHPVLNLERYRPLQIITDISRSGSNETYLSTRVYLLVIDFVDWNLQVFVFNLNLDLLNSFQLVKVFPTFKVI